MAKVKARIRGEVICPNCGCLMTKEKHNGVDVIYCPYRACASYLVEYEVPTVELVPYETAEEFEQRTGLVVGPTGVEGTG